MIRIPIRINKILYSALTEKANKIGLPKSSVVNEWIENVPNSDIDFTNTLAPNNITFNFRVSDELEKQLKRIVELSSVGRSEYIRALIYTNVKDTSSITKFKNEEEELQKRKMVVEKYWAYQQFSEVVDFIGNLKPNEDNNTVNYFAASLFEIGEWRRALKVVNIKKEKNINFQFVEFRIYIEQGEFSKAEKLLNMYELNSVKGFSRVEKGILSYEHGVISFLKNDLSSSSNYAADALDFLDVENHEYVVVNIYLFLLCINQIQEKKSASEFVLNRLRSITKRHNSKLNEIVYRYACIQNTWYIKKDGKKVMDMIKELLPLIKQTKYNSLKLNLYADFAMYSLLFGDNQLFKKIISISKSIVEEIESEFFYNRVMIYQAIYDSYIDNNQKKLENLLKLQSKFNEYSPFDYIYFTNAIRVLKLNEVEVSKGNKLIENINKKLPYNICKPMVKWILENKRMDVFATNSSFWKIVN